MEYVILGRTGLQASVMGLGGGGPSRLGQNAGRSEAESLAVVRRALDLGINFIDTAEAYGTEPIIGRAIKGVDRSQIVLSTKKGLSHEGQLVSASEMVAGVEGCLKRLGTDYVDIFHLHGVKLYEYNHAINEIVPALLDLKAQGKIRFLGITESFGSDPQHQALQRALQDDCWDVMMVGFNILNQSARERIFAKTIPRNIGVLAMFVVRRAFSRPDRLRDIMRELTETELIDPTAYNPDNPLGFLVSEGLVANLTEAAYRYGRHEPGVHVVLSGTGNLVHLEENVPYILGSPLPAQVRLKLAALFARVDTISGS